MIPVANSYKEINAENAIKDKESIFYHYKKLINLRKEYDIIAYGNFKMILEKHDKVLGYVREYNNQKLIVLNNYYGENTEVSLDKDLIDEKASILISNYKDSSRLNQTIKLRPYESVAYLIG